MRTRTRRSYTTEFKLEAVKQVQSSNKTATQVARELGIAENSLRRWCKEQTRLESLPPTEESKDEEPHRLRIEVANLKEDNTSLKKAAAYFAKESRCSTPLFRPNRRDTVW